MITKTLNEKSLAAACNELAKDHIELRMVLDKYGVPPLWDRAGGFPTLVHIILEQQVSLASAKACFDKVCFRLGDLTPEGLLTLTDSELKSDGFSRQKTAYARHLAEAIIEKRLDLEGLNDLDDAQAKLELEKLKGVGNWTSDIYLLMAMLRPDIMPKGDIALHEAYRKLTGAEKRPGSNEFVEIAVKWSPHRSSAARLLWHFYLSERKKPA